MSESALMRIWNDLASQLGELSRSGGGERSIEAGVENIDIYEALVRRMGLDKDDVLGFASSMATDGMRDFVAAVQSASGADAFALLQGISAFSLLAGVELERRDRE